MLVSLFLLLSPCAGPAWDPPATVFVDNEFDESTPGWQVDHFALLQDGIDAVATGGTVVVLAGWYPKPVVVDRPMSLTGQGPGVPLVDASGQGTTITLAADGVTVTGLTVRSRFTSSDPAIRVLSSSNTIRGNVFTLAPIGVLLEEGADGNLVEENAFGEIGTTGLLARSDGNTIEENTFTDSGSSDVYLVGAHSNAVADNTASSVCYYGVRLSSCDDTTIRGNTLFGHTKNIVTWSCNRTTIEDNQLPHDPVTYIGAELFSSPETTLRNNTIATGTWRAATLRDAAGSIVDGNTFPASEDGTDLGIEHSAAVAVLSNVFENGGLSLTGALPEHFDSHTVSGNTTGGRPIRYYTGVVGPFAVPADAGQVLLASCTGVTVSGPFFEGVPQGVLLAHSDGNTIEDGYYGECDTAISVVSSDGNTIRRNHLTAAFYGLSMADSGGNAVTENAFVRCGSAFYSFQCGATPNAIFHNAFVQNTSLYENCPDDWDAGYPAGGNYYDEYTGQDLDADGIGDAAFAIDGGPAVDAYPRTAPFPRGVLWSEETTIAASAPVDYLMYLEAGPPNAGRPYLVLGGISGWSPGTPISGGPTLPLNLDAVSDYVLTFLNSTLFQNFAAPLGAGGTSYAWFTFAPLGAAAVGLEITFAYALTDALDYVSAPLRTRVVP